MGMKNRNRGSTLISVVVGVSFLLILAAIILSASSAGLRMKQMEYVAKKNQYSDEQILNDIYNGIGKVTTDCMTKAYTQVMAQVADEEEDPVYKNQDDAYKAFSQQFMTLLQNNYPLGNDPSGPVEGTPEHAVILDKLRKYITVPDTEAKLDDFQKAEIMCDSSGVPYQYIFRGLKVRYQETDSSGAATGYEAVITTDVVVEIPYINFFQDSSRILDYALIGNQGIYFKDGNARTVEGNLYAGVSTAADPDEKDYRDEVVPGGLNFYQCNNVTINGAYVVSKGDINVRESKVTIGNAASTASAQVWAESIRTVENRDRSAAAALAAAANPSEPLVDLTISASTYAANDLELNARKSRVVLKGEYYGYSNGAYETQEKKSLEGRTQNRYNTTAHTNNSAIIINANESELDLTGLDTLVVAGHAYVDLESRAYQGEPPAGGASGLLEEFETGESLALKTNQYMYLAPTSCLKTTNPVETSSALPENGVWQGDSGWFGIAGGFVDASNPVTAKIVENRTTGESFTYYYLRFLPGKGEDYAGTILQMIDPVNHLAEMDAAVKNKYRYDSYNIRQWNQIWDVKQEIAQKAAAVQVQAVTVAEGTTASIYAEGILSKVTAGGLAGQEIPEENLLSVDTMTRLKNKMHLRYEWMYADLNPKEGVPMASLETPFRPEEGMDAADTSLPASRFVDFSRLTGTRETTYKYHENKDYRTVLSAGPYSVPAGMNFRGIILCKSDVIIPAGTSVEGLVIAGGRIRVEGNGSIRANRSIVQSILDEEMTEESKKSSGAAPNAGYAIYALRGFTPSHMASDVRYRVTGTDYTDYISYQNWKKA